MVCPKDWETRNPQDFLRVSKEIIAPPWSRPEPDDEFTSGYTCPASGMYALAGQAVAGCAIAGQGYPWSLT